MATIIPAPVVPVVPVVYPARGRPSRRRGLIFSFIGGMIMIGIVFGIVRGIQDAHRNNEPKLERRQFQLGGALGDGRDQPVLSMLPPAKGHEHPDETNEDHRAEIDEELQDSVTSFTTVSIDTVHQEMSTVTVSYITQPTVTTILPSSAPAESSLTATTMQLTETYYSTITTHVTTFITFITVSQDPATTGSSAGTSVSSFTTVLRQNQQEKPAPIWKQGLEGGVIASSPENPEDGTEVLGPDDAQVSTEDATDPSSVETSNSFYLIGQISDGIHSYLYPIELKLRLYMQRGEK